MESAAYSGSLPDQGGPRRSAGSNVSTADRDGWQSSVTPRQSSSRQNASCAVGSESTASRPAGPSDPGTAGAATAFEGKTLLGGLSKSTAAPAGGRLPRGVSFLCDGPSPQERSTPPAGQNFSHGYSSSDASRSLADSFAFPTARLQPTRRADLGVGGPRRTLSGILRTQTSGGPRAASSGKEERGSAPLERDEVRKHFPMKSYSSLAPEMIEGFESSTAKGRADGERRRRSLSVADTAAGASSRPAAARRSAYGDWAGGGGGGTPPSSTEGGGMTREISPLIAVEGRVRARLRGQSGHRGTIHVSDGSSIALSASPASGGGAKHAARGGGGGAGGSEEPSISVGLLYRRSRAWPGQPRQLGGVTKIVGGRRTTFRTCSDSHLGPQEQQYLRPRRLQDSGTGGGGAGASGSGSAGGGERSSSGSNFAYYGRSRSTQQYVGRSAGLLWASRYSWLPVFSGPAYCGAEEWVEHDQRMRCFWKQRVAGAPHAAATCVAKHVHVGVTYGLYPLCSARLLMWLCLVCSVYFLSMGLWLIVEDENYLECKLNYEAKGLQNGGSRYLLERIRPDMCGSRGGEVTHLPGPVIYVYVEMEHVFQNDAQILWSRSWRQLAGEVITDPAELKECEPFITAEVDNKTKVLHPCGALAWNVLTDQYHFLEGPEDDDDQFAHTPIHLNQSQAVVLHAYHGWERLYKNPSKAERAKYRDRVYFWMSPEDNDMRLNPNLVKEHARAELTADRLEYREAGTMLENAHFIQWMTAGALGRWRKLYGRLTGPLKLPIYAYISSVYDISPWGGKKAIVLVQHSQFGGRTLFLGIMYVVLGCLLVLLSVWLGWKSWHGRVDTDAAADLRWHSRKRSMKKSK